MTVSAILVCHNGARWLPGVLAGLAEQRRTPDRYIVIDTGSTDDSVPLLRQTLAAASLDVVELGADTSYPAAVRAGLERLPAAGAGPEWVWLLHDDARPDPLCLARLLETATESAPVVEALPDLNPDERRHRGELSEAERTPEQLLTEAHDADQRLPAVVGPKLREWPSLRRLLEVGVTISGTGRRESGVGVGLESGEYDQGQHDDRRDVLAVNTAGMLVRRDVLQQVGLDERLPLFGNDIDFGWRAGLAGHRVVVAPHAVMFHAEAADRGDRGGKLAAHPVAEERASAIYTLLVNSKAGKLPLMWVRLLLGGLLRVIGLLLVRAVGEAGGELRGLLRGLLGVGKLRAGRKDRAPLRKAATAESRDQVKSLLAPFWRPYRHGLDFVTQTAVALGSIGREQAAARHGKRADEIGLAGLLLRSWLLWTSVAMVVIALIAGRDLLGGGFLHGGALLAAPDQVGQWWRAWGSSWHWLSTGTSAAGPAYLLPLAVVATVLLGNPSWVWVALFVLGVPLAFAGAYRFFRRNEATVLLALWGGVAYALLPVLNGAVAAGRLGTVAAAVLLPWVATSALGLGDESADRRGRAAWRTTIGLTLLVAFVPSAWLLAVGLALGGSFLGARLSVVQRLGMVVAPLLGAVGWFVSSLSSPSVWLQEAGRANAVTRPVSWLDLLSNSLTPQAAPWWTGVVIPVIAVVALVLVRRRQLVVRAWAVAAVAALVLAVLSRLTISLPGVHDSMRVWSGFWVLLVHASLVVAIVAAAQVRVAQFRAGQGSGFAVVALAAVVALVGVVAGAGWWLINGSDGPLRRAQLTAVPTYMSELAADNDRQAIVVLRGGQGTPVRYEVLRSGPLRAGEDGVVALTKPDQRFTRLLDSVLADDPRGAEDLAKYGISYLYAPAPVDRQVAGALDASNGLTAASAPREATRAWQVVADRSLSAVKKTPDVWRPLANGVAVTTYIVLIVLALPTRARRRRP